VNHRSTTWDQIWSCDTSLQLRILALAIGLSQPLTCITNDAGLVVLVEYPPGGLLISEHSGQTAETPYVQLIGFTRLDALDDLQSCTVDTRFGRCHRRPLFGNVPGPRTIKPSCCARFVEFVELYETERLAINDNEVAEGDTVLH